MAYRGTITAAGLPAYKVHVYDEGIVVAKPRVLTFLLVLAAISAGLIGIAVAAGPGAGVLLLFAGVIVPSLWRRLIHRAAPASFPADSEFGAANTLRLDTVSSANYESGTGGKRSLALHTRQGATRRFTWWTESNVASNPDDQVQRILEPVLAKPRSFIK